MRKKTHKTWKKGDIALVAWHSLDGELGDGYARCVVVRIQKKKGKPGYSLWVRDPKGKVWQTVDWHRKGVRRETDWKPVRRTNRG